MLNIFKYQKLIVSCSVIATASIGSFVQSASATEQFDLKNSQSNLGTMLIADGNASNGGGGNVSNGGGGNVSNAGGSNAGGSNPFSNPGGGGPSGGPSGGPNRPGTIASRIGAAQGKYDAALSALAAAEAGQTPASSKTSSVRYGRQVADASTCGCPNTDTASGADMSKELIAAKAAEAEAAAELAAAKAEARQFLESVKTSESRGFSANTTIW